MGNKILLVEDDENLGFIIKEQLSRSEYTLEWVKNGEDALLTFENYKPDICILDVMLPGKDGFEIASDIRSKDKQTPILFLTARDALNDRLKGFQSGGDDYITKPFSIEELIHRIEVFLKRSLAKEITNEETLYQCGNCKVDFKNNLLSVDKTEKSLTEKELELLRILISNKDRVVKREEILLEIWGDDDYFIGRSMDVFISRLRKTLKESDCGIKNFHGIGFKWVEAQ